MQQLNIITGQTKEEIAIEFIRKYEPPEGYMGLFSGGKDSVVLKELGNRSGCKIKWYYSLMPETPDVLKFIKKYHSDVTWLRPEYNFFEGVVINFPPHRRGAWCCSIIKEGPGKKVPLVHRLAGIRAEESKYRAQQGQINQWTKKRINYHPIFDWKEWEVWDYIDSNKIPYCKLYDENFSRLGCIICPKRSYKDLMIYKDRYPQYFKLFEKACYKWWRIKGFDRQLRRGRPTKFKDFMRDWYRGK